MTTTPTAVEALRQEPDEILPKMLHPFCNVCGWRKGGVDSWDGNACKCGHSSPNFELLLNMPETKQ